MYSYDVFDILIDKLSDRRIFPSLVDIKLVGFSAGAQTLLRYLVIRSTGTD
jgi:hypothetical protein